jgi:hypothetical protein
VAEVFEDKSVEVSKLRPRHGHAADLAGVYPSPRTRLEGLGLRYFSPRLGDEPARRSCSIAGRACLASDGE